MEAAFEQGLAKWAQSLSVGLTELPASGVIGERVEGRQQPLANYGWSNFARRYDFNPLRAWLAQHGPGRPLLLDLAGLRGTATPRLEMLQLTRLLLEQAWQGSTGVLLSSDAQLLLDAQGKPRSPVYEGVQELWRELAGAAPMAVPTEDGGPCGSALDSPVRCWAFVRGTEGILFLANNTSATQEVAAEVRANPMQMQVLRLRAEGPAVERKIQDVFRFGEEARTRKQQGIYVRLAPGEIVGLSLQLAGEDWTWLRSVGRMAPRDQPTTGPPPASGGQPWWERGKP